MANVNSSWILIQNTVFCHLPIRQWKIVIRHRGHDSCHKGNCQALADPWSATLCKIFRKCCFPFYFTLLSGYQLRECDDVICNLMTWLILFNLLFGSFPFDIYIDVKHFVMLCRKEAGWRDMALCFVKGFFCCSLFACQPEYIWLWSCAAMT